MTSSCRTEGFDAAPLYAHPLLRRVRAAFPVPGGPAGLAAEATGCAQLLQTVARGDNLVLQDRLRQGPRNSVGAGFCDCAGSNVLLAARGHSRDVGMRFRCPAG
ncbi:hypothetical protein ACH470_22565 [Streptomyces bottropensis]|uniref:hypothetical protein n=1 Tax=Streptomyces bottropensis TaxID=42235 RepID=UPI0037969718